MASGTPDSETETLSILNAILRHHVRNHLTVIRGRAQWLGRTDNGTDDVETILRRCDEMAATVDRIEAITNSLERTPGSRSLDVGSFVETEIEQLSGLYDATLVVSIESAGTLARADELFSFVLRELLDNVGAYVDGADPTIDVTVTAADSVSVVVAASGSESIPETLVTDPFATTTGPESDGSKYGLFLSRAILDRYGGSVSVENGSEGDLQLRATLPRV